MKKYNVTLKDETSYYDIEAMSEEEAKEKALKYWDYRTPSITVKEKKKVKRTVHYTVQNDYTQDIWVDEDLDDDEILDLWGGNKIKTSNEPKLDKTGVQNDIFDVWLT